MKKAMLYIYLPRHSQLGDTVRYLYSYHDEYSENVLRKLFLVYHWNWDFFVLSSIQIVCMPSSYPQVRWRREGDEKTMPAYGRVWSKLEEDEEEDADEDGSHCNLSQRFCWLLCRGELISVKERNVNVQRQGALQCICSLGGRRCNSESEQLCNQGSIH